MEALLNNIIQLTKPYADSWEHVQGPGGNTSVKEGDRMLIKASGYTFKNVTDGIGVVLLDSKNITQELENCAPNLLEGKAPDIFQSFPGVLKASMEFEFHAVLKRYVLHTHSIYVNVVSSSTACENLLKEIFPQLNYVLVPYITPGHPLAEYIFHQVKGGNTANVYFLKNHGIIVHGDTMQEVMDIYADVQKNVIDFFTLEAATASFIVGSSTQEYELGIKQLASLLTVEDIRDNILFPDQSIIFRNKISDTDRDAEAYYSAGEQKIYLKSTGKFIDSALGMLHMVAYIKKQHQKTGLEPDYISQDEVDILHRLNSEKYRRSIL